MEFRRLLLAGIFTLGWAHVARSAYAPISEVEKGKLLTVYGLTGGYYDTNIFGAPRNAQESWVFYLAPQAALNWNPRKQMLVALGAGARWDTYEERPGQKDLFSYDASARLAYTFRPRLEAEINGSYRLVRNPESLLAGTSTLFAQDQSREDFSLETRWRWTLTPRNGMTARVRGVDFGYTEDPRLADELDRSELMSSVAWTYLVKPRARSVAEHRLQLVRYRVDGQDKDKDSHLLLGGLDYSVGRKLNVTSRFGGEWRRRTDGIRMRPYGELAAKWDFAKDSYWSGGYAYVVQEVANAAVYHDATVHRMFAQVHHALGARLSVGGSLGFEPTKLNTRRRVGPTQNETAWLVGLAIEYKLRPQWILVLTSDIDSIYSDDDSRDLQRGRWGLSSRLAF